MRCEDCNAREATEEVRIPRARGVVDTYRLCRWCHGQATGNPVPTVRALVDPCPACHKADIIKAGLCHHCLGSLWGAMRAYLKQGYLPRRGSKSWIAAQHVDPEAAEKWVRAAAWKAIRSAHQTEAAK